MEELPAVEFCNPDSDGADGGLDFSAGIAEAA
jgi:hypothetical protein